MTQSSIPRSLPAYLHSKRIGLRAHHGISVPLFSIHSKNSCGIGEFPDLVLLFKWLKELHMDMIQILPINDSKIDISPYNAISGFALHPNFLGLAYLPYINRHTDLKEIILELQSYNTAPSVVYKQVTEKKHTFLLLYFSLYFTRFQKMQKFKSFIRKENAWLQPYALFKSLKEQFGNTAWWTWPKSCQFLTKEKLKKMYLEYESSMNFHIFVQYLCISQLRALYKQANLSHILLKGDIPFLFNRDSVEVWVSHSLFDFRYTIGSPPDKMNPSGQNWGFPTYRWVTQKKEIFDLWKSKLQFAENFYHCYRIDHAIGLYRIWKIPEKKGASKGAFSPKSTSYYLKEGHKRLRSVLAMTKMLPIAEDLGYDIYPIRNNIAKIGIPGTRVMRWEHTETYDYIPTANFPSCSLTKVATHDTSSLSLWWSSEKKEAHAYAKLMGWEYSTDLTTFQRYEILREAHSSRSLLHINPIQEYLAFFVELSPSHPKKDQINIPETNAESNWTYRCRPSIEKLYAHSGLKSLIQKIIKYLYLALYIGSTLPLFAGTQSTSAIHALYDSIPESDIVKLFAFYELYPHTQVGKSALHSAWRNLQKHRTEIISISDCINLPNIDIDTMIQVLLEPAEIKKNFLNIDQIELLEKISDHLMNRQLKGYTIWKKEDIRHLEAHEIDLSRAILLHELDDPNTIRQYEVFLDFITLQILAKLPNSATHIDKIHALNHWVFYEMQFKFPPHSLWPKDIDAYTLLAQVIDNRQGVCLGVSILYICLAQRLGVSLRIFTPPGHIFISYTDENQTINIETTARGRNIPMREYLSSNVRFLPERSIKEIMGMVFINQGAKFLHLQDYGRAAEFYEKAIFYLPNDSTAKELLGFTLLFTKTREEEAIRLLLSTRDQCNLGMIYQSSISKDYLENRINLEGIKILWLPVRETRESIIKKNRELQSLIEKFPITREGLFQLAISYLQLSNTIEAEKVLLKYVQITPRHPTAHYYLSILAKKHMNLAKAWEHYKIAESIIERAGGNLYCLRGLREQLQCLLPETAIMPIKNIEHK